MKLIRIGTRGSDLALWQANHVAGLLGTDKTEIKIIRTKGDKLQNISFDKIEGKAFFTKEIEDALLNNEIDIAVHSLKDLPTEDTANLAIAAILRREDPSDILLIRSQCYNENNFLNLYDSAIIGTSSARRAAQIKNAMKTLEVSSLRGNVPTRIQKLCEGQFDAIIIAKAGINRLSLNIGDLKTLTLPFSFFLPSPSQGALAIQTRDSDTDLKELLKPLEDTETQRAVIAERSFLKHFGGGCHIPLGAFAYTVDGNIHLSGSITSLDGKNSIRGNIIGNDPELLGKQLADFMKGKGADKLI
jgi:hydroxymethylbilane synthase